MPQDRSQQITKSPPALRILFFSTSRVLTGKAETSISCTGPLDESGLWKILLATHPQLAGIREQIRLARNGEFSKIGERFEPGDEVAVIPPVSGG